MLKGNGDAATQLTPKGCSAVMNNTGDSSEQMSGMGRCKNLIWGIAGGIMNSVLLHIWLMRLLNKKNPAKSFSLCPVTFSPRSTATCFRRGSFLCYVPVAGVVSVSRSLIGNLCHPTAPSLSPSAWRLRVFLVFTSVLSSRCSTFPLKPSVRMWAWVIISALWLTRDPSRAFSSLLLNACRDKPHAAPMCPVRQ